MTDSQTPSSETAAVGGRAKPLVWYTPKAEDTATIGVSDDCHSYAVGFGGHYSVEAPKLVSLDLIATVNRARCVVIDGLIHFKALLWWASEPFTFAEFDTVEAAQSAAETDWQERFANFLASAEAPNAR